MIKLYRARSLLYRRQILQENMRLKALDEIYTMHSFAQLCDLNFLSNARFFPLIFTERSHPQGSGESGRARAVIEASALVQAHFQQLVQPRQKYLRAGPIRSDVRTKGQQTDCNGRESQMVLQVV